MPPGSDASSTSPEARAAPRTAPVAVIIPTYDRAPLLREALASVLAQTVSPAEIVVVDDGSTDESAEVVEAAARRTAIPVRYLRVPHRGSPSIARNHGIAAASAAWLAFLDSDDLWLPARLERQFAALRRSPEAGFAFCGVEGFDERGRIAGARLASPRGRGGDVLGDVLEGTRLNASSLVVHRDALAAVGGFRDLAIGGDYELSLRLAARWRASHIADPLVLKRVHARAFTAGADAAGLRSYISIVEAFLARHPSLPGVLRRRARLGVVSAHLKLARLALEEGRRPAALRHLRAATRLRPWDRRVVPTLVGVLLRRR